LRPARLFLVFCCFTLAAVCSVPPARCGEPALVVDSRILDTIFADQELLHFSISWSGGIKIGDLRLEVERQGREHRILARVTDYGLFHFFYPVDDTFTTLVSGPTKLPRLYRVLQREGWGSETRRSTRYLQERGLVLYRKNDQPEERFSVAGRVYNEFSSFFITRALQPALDRETIVPTFVDGKRHLVAVRFLGRQTMDSPWGPMQAIGVMPVMHFRGLYDKEGDTVFWLSDDHCRIPLRIESKILIGSLVADLVGYANQACSVHPGTGSSLSGEKGEPGPP